MSTVVPQSELTRRAMDWIGEQCACQPCAADPLRLIDAAAERFNLSPLEVEFLKRFYTVGDKGEKQP